MPNKIGMIQVSIVYHLNSAIVKVTYYKGCSINYSMKLNNEINNCPFSKATFENS